MGINQETNQFLEKARRAKRAEKEKTRATRKKNKAKTLTHQDFQTHFPRLIPESLQRYAVRWVKRYSGVRISRIVLYHYAPPFETPGKSSRTKYAIIFEVKDTRKKERADDDREFFELLTQLSGPDEKTSELLRAFTETPSPLFQLEDDMGLQTSGYLEDPFKSLIAADFADVYREPPDSGFRFDWFFRTLTPGEELPLSIRAEEPCFALFSTEGDDAKTLRPFPCNPGTKWEDVKITLVSNDSVRIETPNGNGLFTFHDLGMADRRNPERPKKAWAMLKAFACFHGLVSQERGAYIEGLVEKTKALNKELQNLFDITGSIFTDHYRTHRRYRTKIVFSSQIDVSKLIEPEEEPELSAFEAGLEDTNYIYDKSDRW